MFDIGWSELLIIAVVAILIVGPKDLPRLLRQLGNYVGKIKQTANEFKSQFDDAIKDSELDDIKSSVDELTGANPLSDIKSEIEDGLDVDMYSDLEMDDIDLDVEGPSEKEQTETVHKDLSKEPSKQSGSAPEQISDSEEKSIVSEPYADSESSGDAKDEKSLAAENRGA